MRYDLNSVETAHDVVTACLVRNQPKNRTRCRGY